MPIQRVTAIIGERAVAIPLPVPSRHPMESKAAYAARVAAYIAERMHSMGVSSWEEGYATEAASADSKALQQVLCARGGSGETDPRSLLNPLRAPRRRQNRYRP